MLNTTTSAKYSLSTNPHFIGAYVIDNPPDEWSDFTLEEGTGVFAGQVRIRNAFNDHCLHSQGNADAVFSACEAWNADQVCLLFWCIRVHASANCHGIFRT